jgi:hypothetical protein
MASWWHGAMMADLTSGGFSLVFEAGRQVTRQNGGEAPITWVAFEV